jgi:hypothetical protein
MCFCLRNLSLSISVSVMFHNPGISCIFEIRYSCNGQWSIKHGLRCECKCCRPNQERRYSVLKKMEFESEDLKLRALLVSCTREVTMCFSHHRLRMSISIISLFTKTLLKPLFASSDHDKDLCSFFGCNSFALINSTIVAIHFSVICSCCIL